MPQTALEAIRQSHDRLQQLGPFSTAANVWIGQEANLIRQAIATELHAPPTTITLTENVSVGCNIALWGINWQAGDHLLLTDCEHQGIIAAAQQLQRRYGIEISTCALQSTLNQGDPVAAIAAELRVNTRLVVLSHILWNTGQVLPLADIVAACHAHRGNYPVQVLVDAAQSVGVLPLNLTELQADFYAFTGHKWWCGPAGLGGLYIRPTALEDLQPTFIGWRSITTDAVGYPSDWEAGAQRYEVATSDVSLYSGLRTAIALHHQWGTAEKRYQRICQLSGRLWEKLTALPEVNCLRTAPPAAGLVSFQVRDRPSKRLVQFLEQQNLMVRTILNPSCVRACVHYFTLESELDQLVAAIQEFLARN